MSAEPLLKVRGLGVTFRTGDRVTVASQDVNFELKAGQVLAVVGESGSGKSVSAMALTRLLPPEPNCMIQGEVLLNGRDLLKLSEAELTQVRGREIAYIFQDPSTSLNPVYSIAYQIGEAIRLHRPEVTDVSAEVIHSLEAVHIKEPARVAQQYPHELSGGMQQRVMIAMALACNPKILVADEPTTALDVTIQKEIMDLLSRLRVERGMSIILITHNFGIVAHFADLVQVMRSGHIVEQGPAEQVMNQPQHPYTKGLIACIPRLGQRRRRLTTLKDELKAS